MVHDIITEEIREVRHRLAAQCDNNVSKIGEDLRRRQSAGGRRVVQLPKRGPRKIVPETTTLEERPGARL